MAVRLERYHNANGGSSMLLSVADLALQDATKDMFMREVCRIAAERYVSEHYAELVATMDPQAIANLAIAEAGQRISKTIHERPVVMQSDGAKTYNIKRSIF